MTTHINTAAATVAHNCKCGSSAVFPHKTKMECENWENYKAAQSVCDGRYTAELAGAQKVLAGLHQNWDILVERYGWGNVDSAERDALIALPD